MLQCNAFYSEPVDDAPLEVIDHWFGDSLETIALQPSFSTAIQTTQLLV